MRANNLAVKRGGRMENGMQFFVKTKALRCEAVGCSHLPDKRIRHEARGIDVCARHATQWYGGEYFEAKPANVARHEVVSIRPCLKCDEPTPTTLAFRLCIRCRIDNANGVGLEHDDKLSSDGNRRVTSRITKVYRRGA